MLTEIQSSYRFLLFFLTSLYIVNCQLILPLFNDGEDFFIFSTWSLFAQPLETDFYDISWDDGASFAFRDHLQEMKASDFPLYELFYLLNAKKHRLIRDHFLERLKKYADCDHLKIYKFRGTLYQHILLKHNLSVVEERSLCVD